MLLSDAGWCSPDEMARREAAARQEGIREGREQAARAIAYADWDDPSMVVWARHCAARLAREEQQ